jgi:hypothetical protein
MELTAKEKETRNGKSDAEQTLPRSRLTKKDDAGHRHDGSTTGENDRH